MHSVAENAVVVNQSAWIEVEATCLPDDGVALSALRAFEETMGAEAVARQEREMLEEWAEEAWRIRREEAFLRLLRRVLARRELPRPLICWYTLPDSGCAAPQPVARLEGLSFLLTCHNEIHLLTRCQGCKRLTFSPPIRSIVELGEHLPGFLAQRTECQHCQDPFADEEA